MTDTQTVPALKVYWQPGCSSCLKTKEFLLDNKVEFESINVLEDECGFKDLEALGLRLVPVVARGSDWANGAVFRDVARVAGFTWHPHDMLAPGETLSQEEVQMDLCVALYTLQTLLVGNNGHHPRLSIGQTVRAKSLVSRTVIKRRLDNKGRRSLRSTVVGTGVKKTAMKRAREQPKSTCRV